MRDTTQATGAALRGHVAHYAKELFDNGIGHVVVARYKGGGQRVEAGVFLVDVWCLGVKNAFFTELTPTRFENELMARMPENCTMVRIEPAFARKLVEDAVRYAAGLGLAPHPDYKWAARVFGGINASDCQQTFAFGKDGKPLYFQGPHESAAEAERIVNHLRRRCGEGNYNFVVGGPV
jgi:hypothetical protein